MEEMMSKMRNVFRNIYCTQYFSTPPAIASLFMEFEELNDESNIMVHSL